MLEGSQCCVESCCHVAGWTHCIGSMPVCHTRLRSCLRACSFYGVEAWGVPNLRTQMLTHLLAEYDAETFRCTGTIHLQQPWLSIAPVKNTWAA